ncbi:hypothetical protein [Treponema denticola]|uniref:hypothetical protein n=1 Tax=Treponema denticola TaxID=158 RepID=UPI0011C9BE1E|nr:hypothetical protein [Treponema denticola]
MKKTLIFILMILVLIVSSCNLFLKEEYGELIVSFDGTLPDGARALDSNGLPVLSSSPMKINIIREEGYTITRELSAEEPKSLVELVPVGEKIEIIVTAINPSGQWSGRASHTVVSGQNHVIVLLNKKISGLNNLLFTQTKNSSASYPYNLTLYMTGKEINARSSQLEYNFGRDSIGRLYISVNEGNSHVSRYTSEGELVNHVMESIVYFACDYTTRKMYGINGSGGVYEIDENFSISSLTPPLNLSHYDGAAAIDNNLVVWICDDGSNPLKIQAKNLDGSHPSETEIKDHIKITDCKESEVKDMFIRGKYVYVLFNTMNDELTGNSRNLYSLGGIVRYNINDLDEDPIKIGFEDDPDFDDDNGVLEDYDYSKNFYGAVKVIGFDEENIYIADDGFDAADTPAGARIVKNRNRIAALNIATNALSFSDAGPAKWYNEWKEWRTPNTKMVVWNGGGSSYYQVERGDEDLSSAYPFITSSGVLYSDVFCYDSAGNFYVSGKAGGDEKLYRYVLKDDGSYNSDGNKSISVMPDAMAVSVSSIAADAGKTILFYYQKPFGSPFNHEIKRLAWPTDSFSSAASKTTITLSDLGQTDTVTALAANKDGIFVAVKTVTGKDSSNEKYKLTVKKYAHTPLSGGLTTVSGTVTVVGETLTNYDLSDRNKYINENLNALYIKDGILYGLITKQKGYAPESNNSGSKEVFIGGKLIKIGETGASFGSPAVTLYERTGLTPETSGRFAPYRFIAIKPKKLVIASKGYYGKLINNDNPWNPITEKKTYKKVFVFDIGNWANPAETITQAGFSKDLDYCHGFMWK